MARVAFEVIDGVDCSLRIWLVNPKVLEASVRPDCKEAAPIDQVLLRYTAICKDLLGLSRINAGLDVRAISTEVPLTLRVQGRLATAILIEQEFQIFATTSWARAEFEVEFPRTKTQPDNWLYELSTSTNKVMAGVELRDLTLGIKKPNISLASTSPPSSVEFYIPPPGQYSESNILKDTRLTLVSSDGATALQENWKTIQGRGGKLKFSVAAYPWLQDGGRLYQPRELSCFKIEENDYYFRLAQHVPPSRITNLKRVGTELLFGADVPLATKTGLVIQTFFRVVKASGDETIFKLIPRQDIRPGLTHKSAEIEIKDDEVKALTGLSRYNT